MISIIILYIYFRQSRLKVCEDKPTVFLEDPDVPGKFYADE